MPRRSLHSLVLHLPYWRGAGGTRLYGALLHLGWGETGAMTPTGFVAAFPIQPTLAAMQTDELLTYDELGGLLRLKKTAMATAKRRGDLPTKAEQVEGRK